MWQMHAGWGWWVLSSIGMLALAALVLAALVAVLRPSASDLERDRPRDSAPDGPLDVLDRRLASGDITLEEYEELRGALTRRPRAPTPV